MKTPKLFSTYDHIYVEPTHNDEPSLTKQCFAADADINVLKKRFVQENGYDPLTGCDNQFQIDFSDVVSDFSDIKSLADVFAVADTAEMAFSALPPEKRALVHNDPSEFKRLVSTMSDNELAKFGLFNGLKGGIENAPTPPVQKAEPSPIQANGGTDSQA